VSRGPRARPLAWPLSTYRDAVGLSAWPVRPAERDPYALHAYVSADPSVAVRGTELPLGLGRPATLPELLAATSELTRTPYAGFQRRGAPRALLVRAARVLCSERDFEIADFVGLDRSAVCRMPRTADPTMRAIARIAGDPRFPGIPDGRVPFARRYTLGGHSKA
jgi:hypothetical protein